MHVFDYVVFAAYFMGVLSVGYYFFRKNANREDYYVGGRSIGAGHVGLSIAATDVGGGFSIGLGGLGFTMGISGSWLLFTGLVGAWLAAIFTVPRLKRLDMESGLLTFPDFLASRYGGTVAVVAAVISGIGYMGFTSGQILAGGKLAAGSIFSRIEWADPLLFSLIAMTIVVVLYTVMGGLKAVIYTDTVQWIILLSGLLLLGLPFAYIKLGGWDVISKALPPTHFSLGNISWVTLINWSFSIVPIWFIAMTLYQRVYACPTIKEARKAFFIAGIFEYPLMAFSGVILGMLARMAFPESDAETALPLLLNTILPIGIAGFVLAAYFSAVMSTADSCLIASSANFVNDILTRLHSKELSDRQLIRISQFVTLVIGLFAFLLATWFTSVLDIVLQSYAFMVSGLLVPTLAAYFTDHRNPHAALVSMIGGGSTTLLLTFLGVETPFGLDATIFGILTSFLLYIITYQILKTMRMFDRIEKLGQSLVQHGPNNDRVYLMKLHPADLTAIVHQLHDLAILKGYTKIFAKIPEWALTTFLDHDFNIEANIPNLYNNRTDGYFVALFFGANRSYVPKKERKIMKSVKEIALGTSGFDVFELPKKYHIRKLEKKDTRSLARVYRKVFQVYPFPIFDEKYILETMSKSISYFGVFEKDKLVAASSAELDKENSNAEMTDFATLPDHAGRNLSYFLLQQMELEMASQEIKTLYTIARASSYGMNKTFGRLKYDFGGTTINNTLIGESIESMNIWYKKVN